MQGDFSRLAVPSTVLALTLFICQSGCMTRHESINIEQDSSVSVAPLQLTDRTFQDTLIGSNQLVLVDMWAPWCQPCIGMKPTIQELAQQMKDKVIVAELNIDQNPFIKEKYQIQRYPTVLIFDRGIEVKRLVGAQSKSDLIDALEAAVFADVGMAGEEKY